MIAEASVAEAPMKITRLAATQSCEIAVNGSVIVSSFFLAASSKAK